MMSKLSSSSNSLLISFKCAIDWPSPGLATAFLDFNIGGSSARLPPVSFKFDFYEGIFKDWSDEPVF